MRDSEHALRHRSRPSHSVRRAAALLPWRPASEWPSARHRDLDSASSARSSNASASSFEPAAQPVPREHVLVGGGTCGQRRGYNAAARRDRSAIPRAVKYAPRGDAHDSTRSAELDLARPAGWAITALSGRGGPRPYRRCAAAPGVRAEIVRGAARLLRPQSRPCLSTSAAAATRRPHRGMRVPPLFCGTANRRCSALAIPSASMSRAHERAQRSRDGDARTSMAIELASDACARPPSSHASRFSAIPPVSYARACAGARGAALVPPHRRLPNAVRTSLPRFVHASANSARAACTAAERPRIRTPRTDHERVAIAATRGHTLRPRPRLRLVDQRIERRPAPRAPWRAPAAPQRDPSRHTGFVGRLGWQLATEPALRARMVSACKAFVPQRFLQCAQNAHYPTRVGGNPRRFRAMYAACRRSHRARELRVPAVLDDRRRRSGTPDSLRARPEVHTPRTSSSIIACPLEVLCTNQRGHARAPAGLCIRSPPPIGLGPLRHARSGGRERTPSRGTRSRRHPIRYSNT